MRSVFDTATSRLDGKRAATSTVLRTKTTLQNALDYALELQLLPANPIKGLKWKPPKSTYEVDSRSVVNHAQARALLAAVAAQKPSGERLVAFFALMYHAALRPEEAINLRGYNILLPPLVSDEKTGQLTEPTKEWGELRLTKAAPFAGREWTDDGALREERSLKHRAGRPQPPRPDPARTRQHPAGSPRRLARQEPGDHLFRGTRGELPDITYRRVWAKARRDALTPH